MKAKLLAAALTVALSVSFSMNVYVDSLLCDDLERENGNIKKADSMRKNCEKYGWIPVSMKNDWKTIYGYNVKKQQQ